MSSDVSTCPYCNALVALPAGTTTGQRVPCTRCGESFAYRPADATIQNGGLSSSATALASPSAVSRTSSGKNRRANRIIAALVLCLMVVMGGVGLYWSLKTVPDRRNRDAKEPVGYLPSDCEAVIGVQMVKTLEATSGRDLTREIDQMLKNANLPTFEKWTGLRWEDVNQAFLGVKVSGRIIPRLTLVVETRDAYDANRVRTMLKAARPFEHGQKKIYRFQPKDNFPELKLWCPSDTILIVALTDSDLTEVPDAPFSGVSQLPSWMQSLLLDETGTYAQAWVMAHSDDWKKTFDNPLLNVLLGRYPEKDRQILSEVETLAIWLRFDEEIQIDTACRCKTSEKANDLKSYLAKNEIAAEDSIIIKKDVWVTVQSRASAAAICDRLKGWVGNLLKAGERK